MSRVSRVQHEDYDDDDDVMMMIVMIPRMKNRERLGVSRQPCAT